MKLTPFLFLSLATVAAPVALAADVGISISVGEPGFYGSIDIGGAPPPVLVQPQPIIAEPAPAVVVGEPIYLHVPPEHISRWQWYCRQYNACGRPVYFVQDRWYNEVYVPHYREHHAYREERYNAAGLQPARPAQGNPWLQGSQRYESVSYGPPSPPADRNHWGEGFRANMPSTSSGQEGGQGRNHWFQHNEPNNPPLVQPAASERGNPWLQGTQRHLAAPTAKTDTRERGPWVDHTSYGFAPTKSVNNYRPQTTAWGDHEGRHEEKEGKREPNGAPDSRDNREHYQW